jgi:DNA polymerase III subunit delta'
MPLSEVQGQENASLALGHAFSQGRLHHAYLLHGPEGIGKKKLALSMAELLLCKATISLKGGGYDSCGECGGCRRVQYSSEPQRSGHPDLHLINREKNKEGKLASEIKVAQVRALQKTLSYTAFEGGRRVILIEEADRMGLSTANALLKTLEEPGADTYFILITQRGERLLPTITSRCQQLRMSPLPIEIVESLIKRHTKSALTDQQLHTVARLSEGSIGRALRYADDELFEQIPSLLSQVDREGGVGELVDAWGAIKRYERAEEGEVRLWLHLLRSWYRDLLIIHQGGSRMLLTHIALEEIAHRRAQRLSFDQICWRIQAIGDAERHLFERVGSNRRLILEALVLYLSGADAILKERLLFT